MLAGFAYGYAFGAPSSAEGAAPVVVPRAIGWPDVVELDATLAATPAALQDIAIDLVLEIVSPRAFGGETSKRLRTARLLLAAHFAVLMRHAASGAHSGPETSRSGLSISKSFAAPTMTPDGLSETAHGRAYLMLARTSPWTQAMRA